MNKLTLALATIPALVLVPSIALADSNGPFIERPLTKDAGLLEIEGDVIVNLSKDRVAKPFAVAPAGTN